MVKRRTRSSAKKDEDVQQQQPQEPIDDQEPINGAQQVDLKNEDVDMEPDDGRGGVGGQLKKEFEPGDSSPIVVDSTCNSDQVDLYNYDDDDDQEDDEDEIETLDEVKVSAPSSSSHHNNNQHVIELKAKIDTDDEFHEMDQDLKEEEDFDVVEKVVVSVEKTKKSAPEVKVEVKKESEEKKKSSSSSSSSKKPSSTSTTSTSGSSATPSSSTTPKDSKDNKKDKTRTSSTSSSHKTPSSTTKSSESSSTTPSSKPKSSKTSSALITLSSATSSKETPPSKSSKSEAPSSSTKKSSTTASSSEKKSSSTSSTSDYDEEYWRRMANRSKDSFHDPTDKELFLENIWKRIKGKELALCTHKHSTDCILWMIESGRDSEKLRKFCENLSIDALPSTDMIEKDYLSEIIEAQIEQLVRLLVDEKNNLESNTSKWVIKYMDSLAKYVADNLRNLLTMDSSNGTRVVIATIEGIGGIRVGRHWSRQNMRFGSGVKVNLQNEIEKDMSFKELPSQFKHHLKRLAKILVTEASDLDIKEFMFGRATQLAQYLLFILKVRYPELCQMVVKKLVEVVFANPQDRDNICQSASSAYIVEIIMMVASETRLSKIWTKCLKGELQALWKHDIANFIVQRLIDAIRDENLFADVCKEIFPNLAEIFKYNRAGIGVCLAKACQDFPKMQHELVSALLKAYDCYEPKDKQLDLVPSMLFIESKLDGPGGGPGGASSDRGGGTRGFQRGGGHHGGPPGRLGPGGLPRIQIWLHGSLMLQYMMSYTDPYKVCKSLLSLSTEDVIKIAKDRSGSHVIDAFIHGENVPAKHKSELVERFLGHYHHMSLDKFGSRIVENILSLSDTNVKRAIMEELAQHEAKLTANRNGWFVAKKVGLHHFKHRPGDWKAAEFQRDRKKRTFSEFLSGPLGPNRGQGPSGSGFGGGAGGAPEGGGDHGAGGARGHHHRGGFGGGRGAGGFAHKRKFF